MGSRKFLLVVALFFVTATPAHAAIRLFHDSFSSAYRTPFGAVPTRSKVTLRLRVTGGKATSVSLHFAKRFVQMRRRGALWSSTVVAPASPAVVTYDFRVRVGRRRLWYGDNGDTDLLKGGTGIATAREGIPYTLTVYAAGFTTPSWLRGAVVYSIFPDRFRNGDPSNDYCRPGSTTGCPVFYGDQQARAHLTWNEPVATPSSNNDFFGGDLQGVQQKLPYLHELGVDAIWLNPIFAARSNSRYDTDNYYEVDPAIGGNAAFASLVSAAHAQEIKLILDGVFNHASTDSLYFDRYHRYPTDGACESQSSPFFSWFTVTKTPCGDGDYKQSNPAGTLAVFNHDNAGVKDFFYGSNDAVAKHWLAAGADGWRLDSAQEIDHSWWRELRTAVKSAFPKAPLIAEDTAGAADATQYLLGNEFDGVMNYRFRDDALGFAGGTMTPSALDHALNAMREDYPAQALEASFNLIDSHDTQRALAVLDNGSGIAAARERLRLAALLQYTYVGAPMVLYGDEAALNAPGNAPYPWTDESGNVNLYGPPDPETLDFYTKFARLRHDYPVLKTGRFASLFTGDTTKAQNDNDVYAFLRFGGPDQPVVAVFNTGNQDETARIPLRGAFPGATRLVEAVKSRDIAVRGGVATIKLPPRTGGILVHP